MSVKICDFLMFFYLVHYINVGFILPQYFIIYGILLYKHNNIFFYHNSRDNSILNNSEIMFIHCAFQLISIKPQLGYFDLGKKKKKNS